MKRNIFLTFAAFFLMLPAVLFAQEQEQETGEATEETGAAEANEDLLQGDDPFTRRLNDFTRLQLDVLIPEEDVELSGGALNLFRTRINAILTNNGLGGDNPRPRFIVFPVVTVIGKEIAPTNPPMQVIDYDVSMFLGDFETKTNFSTINLSIKGVGRNDQKAMINAIQNIRVRDARFEDFLDEGKQKVVAFYNTQCDFIIREAQAKVAQNQYEEAIADLMMVPNVSTDCFNRTMDLIPDIYAQYIDFNCEELLLQAKAQFANLNNREALQTLSQVVPGAACYEDVLALVDEISLTAEEQREWEFMVEQYRDSFTLRKMSIEASIDIAEARARQLPPTVIYRAPW